MIFTAKDIYWFIRPSIGVIACFAVSLWCASLIASRFMSATPGSRTSDERIFEAAERLVLPCRTMTPDEVVRIQLAGLAEHPGKRAEGILQCMAFASPQNRLVTGPLERFGRMVRHEPYDVLAHPDAVLVGKPKFINGRARVLVTLINSRRLRLFVWVLSKQQSDPFEGCWMTDAVFSIGQRENQEETTAGEEHDVAGPIGFTPVNTHANCSAPENMAVRPYRAG